MLDKQDFDLYQRWLAGDTAAGGALVLQHHDSLVVWISRRVWTVHVASDIAQEVWLEAMKGGYEGRGAFRGWLFRVARSKLGRLYRALAEGLDDVHRSQLSLSTWVFWLEARHAIEELSNSDQQRVLQLGLDDGLSIAEIAVVTGAGEKTVRSRIRLGVEKLKSRLKVV